MRRSWRRRVRTNSRPFRARDGLHRRWKILDPVAQHAATLCSWRCSHCPPTPISSKVCQQVTVAVMAQLADRCAARGGQDPWAPTSARASSPAERNVASKVSWPQYARDIIGVHMHIHDIPLRYVSSQGPRSWHSRPYVSSEPP